MNYKCFLGWQKFIFLVIIAAPVMYLSALNWIGIITGKNEVSELGVFALGSIVLMLLILYYTFRHNLLIMDHEHVKIGKYQSAVLTHHVLHKK